MGPRRAALFASAFALAVAGGVSAGPGVTASSELTDAAPATIDDGNVDVNGDVNVDADVEPRQNDAGGAFQPLDAPVRLADTRPGGETADGAYSGGGEQAGGSTLSLAVGGRAGVPGDADVVALNITAAAASERGFVVAYPCNEERPLASNLNHAAGQTIAVGALVRVGINGTICIHNSGATNLVIDATGYFPEGGVDALDAPQRLADTREASATVDGQFERIGQRSAGSTLELDVAGRGDLPDDIDSVVLTVTAAGATGRGYITVFSCADDRPTASNLNHWTDQTVANTVVARVDDDGRVCIYNHTATHLVVDAAATVPSSTFNALDQPQRILDTRAGEPTADGAFAGTGQRPAWSYLDLDVAGRVGIPDDAGAVILNLTAVDATTNGFFTVFPSGVATPTASNLNFVAERPVANFVVAPIGENGAVRLHNSAPVHAAVDVVGWLSDADQVPPENGNGNGNGTGPGNGVTVSDCEPLMPTCLLVGLFGTDRSDQLGALGEQPPAAAAERLLDVMEPWEEGDRPVLGLFDLIATIATEAPGDDGMYRSPSSDDLIQRYLDVAREYGFYLMLDIQPGRSDFLTEVQRYEQFLREPDVGVALDPEWRMGPDEVPGELVGQVSAAEVNEVAEYLAGIVDEEGLPPKLLLVHQFQDRMITERDDLIAPPELVVNIHMDGFGTRDEKLATYAVTQVDPPLTNGFKLFYDEDVDLFSASDVLGFDPVPDLITYQ